MLSPNELVWQFSLRVICTLLLSCILHKCISLIFIVVLLCHVPIAYSDQGYEMKFAKFFTKVHNLLFISTFKKFFFWPGAFGKSKTLHSRLGAAGAPCTHTHAHPSIASPLFHSCFKDSLNSKISRQVCTNHATKTCNYISRLLL